MSSQTENKQQKNSENGNHDKSKTMNRIAITVTITVIGATLAIGGLSFMQGAEKAVSFIGQSLLPLWATWVGTILAFYFSRENFEAANASTEKLLDKLTDREQQLKNRNVGSVMKKFENIKTLFRDKHDGKFLDDIIEEFEPYYRFPVFDNETDRILDCIVHRATMTEYLYELSKTKKDEETEKDGKTLNEFLSEKREKLQYSPAFVSATATLLEAKTAMDNQIKCEDVFITESGKRDEKVLGWITNSDILKLVKL